MYHSVIGDAKLPEILLQFDEDLARRTRSGGCRHCGGVLHSARYPRKVRPGPWDLGPEQDFRHSLCCSRQGCRRRTMPPSVRFLPRRVYLSAVIVLAAAMMQGPTPWRVKRLAEHLGVDRRTLLRWRAWWHEGFAHTALWRDARARFMPPVDGGQLPAALLLRFAGEPSEQMLSLLRFIAPLSTIDRS